jgi:hypothetical protein
MQPNPNDRAVPRETASGLRRGDQPQRPSTKLRDERELRDEHVEPAVQHSGKHVTADTWNQ